MTAGRVLAVILLAAVFSTSLSVAAEEPFKPGEKLLYTAHWFVFDAGMAETGVSDFITKDGRKYAKFYIHTWSANTIDKLFHMDDWFESVWDMADHVPRSFSATVRESHAVRDKKMEFDHKDGFVRVLENSEPEKIFKLKPLAQDFISASYYTREQNLVPRNNILVPIFEDNRNYDAKMAVIKKERIKVLDGEVDTVMIIGILGFEGAFENSHRVYIWLSDDEHRVPVRLEMSFSFGTVELNLVKAEGVPLDIIRKPANQ